MGKLYWNPVNHSYKIYPRLKHIIKLSHMLMIFEVLPNKRAPSSPSSSQCRPCHGLGHKISLGELGGCTSSNLLYPHGRSQDRFAGLRAASQAPPTAAATRTWNNIFNCYVTKYILSDSKSQNINDNFSKINSLIFKKRQVIYLHNNTSLIFKLSLLFQINVTMTYLM